MCCHPCWDITATPQPLQAHSQAPTSHGFLAPIALLSYHFTFYYCTSSLFPLPYTLLCSFMNSSNVQYSHIQKTITNTHTYMHTTEFTHCLHTSAILFHGTWWMLIAPAIIPTFSAVSPAHYSFKLSGDVYAASQNGTAFLTWVLQTAEAVCNAALPAW